MDQTGRVMLVVGAGLLVGIGAGALLQMGVFEDDPGRTTSCDILVHYPADNLVDGSLVEDISGNGNDLDLGGASLVSGRDGLAISLQEGGARSATSAPISGGDFTLSFWFRPAPTEGNLIELVASGGYPRMKVRTLGEDGRLRWTLWENEQSSDSHTTARTSWNTSEWYHVAIVQSNNTQEWAVYIDGSPDRSGWQDITVPMDHEEIRIGSGNEDPLLALIDDVRIYDRALTATEIDLVMDRPESCPFNPSG